MSRRGLLLAGGAAILAGCGKDEAAGPPPLTEALQRSFAAEEALSLIIALTAALPARDRVFLHRALLGRISDRASDRAGRAAAALSAAGGRPHDASEAGERENDLVLLGRAALEAHVAALPSLTGRELRALGASLVAESAADVAVIEDLLGTTTAVAFPGTPS